MARRLVLWAGDFADVDLKEMKIADSLQAPLGPWRIFPLSER